MKTLFQQFLQQTGLPQAEAARQLGVSKQYISQVCKKGCSISQLKYLAQKLGYTVEVETTLKIVANVALPTQ